MIPRNDDLMRRMALLFVGVCCLTYFSATTLKMIFLRTRGVPVEARIEEIKSVRRYSKNPFRKANDSFVKLSFSESDGSLHSLDAKLTAEQKDLWLGQGQSKLPIIYVRGSDAFVIGKNLPRWNESLIRGALLLLFGLTCFYFGIKR